MASQPMIAGPPFDRLTPAQRAALTDAAEVATVPAGATLLAPETPAAALFLVAAGRVEERDQGVAVASYGPGDLFDTRTLFGATPRRHFIAAADTDCHRFPRELVARLAAQNKPFGDLLFSGLAARVRAMTTQAFEQESAALALARFDRTGLRAPVWLDPAAPLTEAAAAMRRAATSTVLVARGGAVGIVTGTRLRDAVLIEGLAPATPVDRIARFELVSLPVEASLGDALMEMVRHRVGRVVVRDGDQIVGVVEQVDLLRMMSNHSHVIALQIDRAGAPAELAPVAAAVRGLVTTLSETGVRAGLIGHLVTDLNRRLLRRLFELVAPPALVARSCLIVMGSEGRGEQILATDQDNGLILADEDARTAAEPIAAALSDHLAAFGFPPCPGQVMVSNPHWTRPVGDWRRTVRRWITEPTPLGLMHLAIFVDAAAVAGDAGLLAAVKRSLFDHLTESVAFFSQFARAAFSFEDGASGGLLTGWFRDRDARHRLDLKKAGLFPLVHGLRTLALERGVGETHSLDRLARLSDQRVIDHPFAADLAEAFEFLQALRLRARLGGAEGPGAGGDEIRTDRLSKLDRDRLTDSLNLVGKLKDLLITHYRLNWS